LDPMKTIKISMCSIFLVSLAVGCSTFIEDDQPLLLPAYADPAVDTAYVTPQDSTPESTASPQDKQDLVKQKNKILVNRCLGNAQNLKEQLKYEDAERQLIEALNIDPSNTDAIKALNEIQSLLGKRTGEIGEIKRIAAERYEVRKQQLKHKALDDFNKGEIFMEREDYSQAMLFFENVINQINWSAEDVDWGSLKDDAEAKLAEAKKEKVKKDTIVENDRRKEAFDKIRQEEQSQNAQKNYQIDLLLDAGCSMFMKQKFDECQKLAEEILKISPRHEKALGLLNDIDEARRAVNKNDYVLKKREAYLEMKEQLEDATIPYSETLNGPSDEFWDRITKMRSSTQILGLPAESSEDKGLRIRMKNAKSDFKFEEEEITTVANVIRTFTNIPVNVHPEVKAELEDNDQVITLDLQGISVESLLNIICSDVGEGLTWVISNGTVVITKQEKLTDDIMVRFHTIKDITFGLTTFRGPIIGQIIGPDQTGDDEETSMFGGELEKMTPIPPEDVVNLIQENIARESWDSSDLFSIDISQDNSSILIIHTPKVQKQVADFLDDLRKFASCCVTVECRFITVNDSFIQEIGAEWRGLGNDGKSPSPILDVTNGFEDNASIGMDNQGDGGAGANPSAGIFFNDNSDGDIRFRNEGVFQNALGDVLNTIGGGAFQFSLLGDTMFNLVVRAVEKSYNATEITAPILTAFNTQRAYITVINQVTFIQGFDVDVATSAFIANPNVGVIQEGIVLDVKPTVSYDRKYITLELQATVADLKRPIRTISTSLAGQTTPVTFQLPDLAVSQAQTTVRIPDGGSLILGGMKKIRRIDRVAESPILGRLPIIGFFFREKGIDDEVLNLIILARAQIVDMNKYRDTANLSR